MTDLPTKLQLRSSGRLVVIDLPGEMTLELAGSVVANDLARADAALAFVHRASDLHRVAGSVMELARRGGLAWIAYPKAGALGTDLSRDRLKARMAAWGARPVRQIAVDDTWSAVRFRAD